MRSHTTSYFAIAAKKAAMEAKQKKSGNDSSGAATKPKSGKGGKSNG